MSRRKATPENPYENYSGQGEWIENTGKGGWREDGTFDPHADYANPNRATRFVRRVVWMRRNTSLTPRQAAMLFEAHGLSSMARNVEHWLAFDQAWQWPGVPTSSTAESAIKHSGHGWRYPEYLAADDTSPPLDPASAKAIIAEHAKRLAV